MAPRDIAPHRTALHRIEDKSPSYRSPGHRRLPIPPADTNDMESEIHEKQPDVRITKKQNN
jgi:hypothetical protein